jgi:MSHA biogenesis protein MshQ
MKQLLSLPGCLSRTSGCRLRSAFAVFGLWCLLLGAPAAQAQLTFIPSSQSGFTTQTYTNADLKTVDFNTVTLANAPGLTYATTLSSGGAFSATASNGATGFSGNSMQVTSGTSSASGSKVKYTFAGGTPYVSFLWNLRTGDSDNTVKFNLSDGSSVSVSNCSANTTTCVGGYDTYNFFTSLFSLIFGSTAQSTTQAARLVYLPPSGVTVSSMELSSVRFYSCSLFIFCSYANRYFMADALSYVDNSANLPAGLHHLEILSDRNSVVTCQTSAFKVRACANASCSASYTGGVSGTLTLTGASGVSFPSGATFSIASGASMSGSISARTTSTGTLTVGASSVTPAPTATGYCGLGAPASNAAGACSYKAQSTGLVLGLANHRSGTAQTLNLSLVKNVLGSCVAVNSGGTLGAAVTAVYSGATSPTLGGSSLTSGVAKTLNLVFNTAGLGSSTFQYNNSGPVQLNVTLNSLVSGLLSSVVGLSAQTVSYVAPAAFKVEPVINGVTGSTAVVGAGNTIQLKVSALNGLSTPTVTTNFGTEAGIDPISIAKTLLKPSTRKSGAANNPAITLGDIVFNNGVATIDLTWSEVGTLDLSATLGDYLDTGMNVTGALTSVIAGGLRFVPDSFNVTPTAKCGAFTYAGQPFDAVITAVNAAGATTLNYDGSAVSAANRTANAVTVAALSGATGGSFGSSGAVAATAFGDGTATSTLTYNLTNKLTAPNTVVLKATDPDVTDSTNPSMTFRSGRIKLSNAFGSESQPLQIPMQVQYWSGKSWVPASDDSCTTSSLLPLSRINLGNLKSHQGIATTALSAATPSALALTTGLGSITLAAPGAKKTGTIDVTLDLSATGANMPWLQSLDVSCGANTVCNPKARATFGVYTPESQKTVNIQNVN